MMCSYASNMLSNFSLPMLPPVCKLNQTFHVTFISSFKRAPRSPPSGSKLNLVRCSHLPVVMMCSCILVHFDYLLLSADSRQSVS